jgi:hypothetical protein
MSASSVDTLKTVFQAADSGVRRSADIKALAREIRILYPKGVNTILIGSAPLNGFKTLRAPNGTSAVLIGMLLPAVQKIRESASREQQLLNGLVKPGGTLGFVMSDGTVQEAQTGRRKVDCEGYAYLSESLL